MRNWINDACAGRSRHRREDVADGLLLRLHHGQWHVSTAGLRAAQQIPNRAGGWLERILSWAHRDVLHEHDVMLGGLQGPDRFRQQHFKDLSLFAARLSGSVLIDPQGRLD